MNQHSISLADQRLAALNMLASRRKDIQAALDKQSGEGFTFDHVFDAVASNRKFFFWNEDSCVVVEVRRYPSETTLHIFLGAGSNKGLKELYAYVSEWGKTVANAKGMTALCRKGFKRTLGKWGWYEPQVWLRKDFD